MLLEEQEQLSCTILGELTRVQHACGAKTDYFIAVGAEMSSYEPHNNPLIFICSHS